MKVEELLRIPYIRSAESVFDETSQSWVRRFQYAELPGCSVESLATLEGLQALELTRVGIILRNVVDGRSAPRPRPPLRSLDLSAMLNGIGLDLPPSLLNLPEERARQSPEAVAAADVALFKAASLSTVPVWGTDAAG